MDKESTVSCHFHSICVSLSVSFPHFPVMVNRDIYSYIMNSTMGISIRVLVTGFIDHLWVNRLSAVEEVMIEVKEKNP